MPNHTQDELKIFEEFSKLCPMGIETASIAKRQPPQPDIYCRTVGGDELAFELVEIVDSKVAKVGSNQVRLQGLLESCAAQTENFSLKFGNALIAVGFRKGRPLRACRNLVPKIVQFSAELPEGVEGEVEIKGSSLEEGVSRLQVERGNFFGPSFHVDAVTSFGDPALSVISEKLGRDYPAETLLHLLAYYAKQPMDAGTSWQPALEEDIRILLNESSFRAVWLFELNSGRLIEIVNA